MITKADTLDKILREHTSEPLASETEKDLGKTLKEIPIATR